MGEVAGNVRQMGQGLSHYKAAPKQRRHKVYMTYLNYAPEIQAMIYTTNWIERLNRDFRRVTRMRTVHAQRRIGADPDGRCGNGSQGI